MPSQKPRKAGRNERFPIPADCSIAGISKLQTEAATITPGINSNNQLVFSSDMQQYVTNRNILLLMSTVSTGRSLARAAECIRYYGGKPVGIGSIFSAVEEAAGLPVHSIFMRSDLNEYNVYRSDECPLCKNGRKLDGFVTVGGCTEI